MPTLSPTIADPRTASDEELAAAVRCMVEHRDYPCLGAKSVMQRNRAAFRVYDELGDPANAAALLADLAAFADEVDLDVGFASFIALFRGPHLRDELHFEERLWAQLRALHAADDAPWADGVSPDPDDPHFAFSAAGTAYFVVGLHPRASRDARRAPVPTLVFNLHEQFEALRASGTFLRMRDRIRARDAALQGRRNPMASDHGSVSEARQYAGRPVASQWRAPFRVDPLRLGPDPDPDPGGSGQGPDRGGPDEVDA